VDAYDNSSMNRCDFNTQISFTTNSFNEVSSSSDVMLGNLPQSGRIVFEFFSKNNHPVAWAAINLFDCHRSLQSGAMEVLLMDGARPTNISDCNHLCSEWHQSKLLTTGRSTVNVLSVAFPTFETVHVIREFDVAARFFAFPTTELNHHKKPLDRGVVNINSPDWYLSHMTNREKKKYLLAVELFSTQILTPQVDIDFETARLIWRMRTAMRTEYPWAVTLFVLSVDWLNPDESEEAYKLL